MAKKEESTEKKEQVVENPFANFRVINGPTVESLTKEVEETKTEEEPEVIEDKVPVTKIPAKKEEIEAELALIKEEEKYFKEKGKKPESKTKETEEEIPEEIKEEESEEFSFKPLVDHLSSKNILDVPEGVEFEDSEEYLEKAIDNTATKRAEEKYNGLYESLPDDGKQLLEFMIKGGDPKEFVNVYYNQGSYKDIKLESESTQKDIIRDGLRLAGWDDEAAIEEEIKDAEDLGKLETKSKMFLTKLQKAEDEQKAEMLQQQEVVNQNKIKQQQEYWTNLKSELDKKTEINGFPLTEKIKAQVWDHMSKPVDKKTGKTQLMVNNEKNKDAQYLYAYLDMMNWDISKLEKSVKTKVTSELRKNLGKFTDSRTKIAKQGSTEKVEEDDSNPFGGFKSAVL